MNEDDIRPVLAGCHPDPSVCRVGGDFFMVTSTFTFFPGLPVHRSRDLCNWELIGHVLADPTRADLDGLDTSDGVWAPTIRYHRGIFYVVYTVAVDRRGTSTFISTATNAAGPWTEPVPLEADGIDPSLFFDDDGRCWFTAARDAIHRDATGPGEIWMREFDVSSLALVGPEYVLWHGALAGAWVEAPHLYKREGRYVLIAAEGGTERNHAVTAAQAAHITGPYRTDPRSPLLTHRHLGENFPVQNVGHADLVDAADGSTFALVLGVRPKNGVHVLGREVFLAPVDWDVSGPVFAKGRGHLFSPLGLSADGPRAHEWVSLRGAVQRQIEDSRVRLAPSPDAMASRGRPAFVGLRQDRHEAVFAATVTAPPPGQATSLVAFQSQDRFVEITLTQCDGEVIVETALVRDGIPSVLATHRRRGAQRIAIVTHLDQYCFGEIEGSKFISHASVDARLLSTEDAGGFVGVLLGIAHKGAVDGAWATADDVSYGPVEVLGDERAPMDPELRRAMSVGAIN